jgi:uncharacterized protein YwgA
MNATSETRVAVLARMVKLAPGQSLGRTQVMKLFYFLQELKGVNLGYDFRLFNYGPFDSEVLSDLSSACGQGTVVEKTVYYPRGYGYDISPGPQADHLCTSLEKSDPNLASMVDQVIGDFGLFGAAELELRSTILFVDRELSQGGNTATSQELTSRVQKIKPHFNAEVILDRVREMKDKGWLESLRSSTAVFS